MHPWFYALFWLSRQKLIRTFLPDRAAAVSSGMQYLAAACPASNSCTEPGSRIRFRMLTRPRWLLQTEGACYLALGLALYRAGHFPWWLFLALFLAPDLFLLAYLAN